MEMVRPRYEACMYEVIYWYENRCSIKSTKKQMSFVQRSFKHKCTLKIDTFNLEIVKKPRRCDAFNLF